MNTNTKEKFLKDEIFDAFLKEYFIFDCLLDGGFNRKKLLSIVYDYMGFSKENLDELYELLQDKDLTIIKTLSDYNRTNRIIEYNRIYNSYFNSDDDAVFTFTPTLLTAFSTTKSKLSFKSFSGTSC